MHRCGKTFIISFLKLCSSNSTIVCVYWLNVEYKKLKRWHKILGGQRLPPPPRVTTCQLNVTVWCLYAGKKITQVYLTSLSTYFFPFCSSFFYWLCCHILEVCSFQSVIPNISKCIFLDSINVHVTIVDFAVLYLKCHIMSRRFRQYVISY